MLRLVLVALGVISASFLTATFALEPLERIQVTEPRLADFRGNKVSESVIVNQLVIITADLTNGQDVTQEFVYIVQIKDEQNVIRYLNFFKAEVEQAKTFSPGVSWTPNTSGKYIVEIYVWESFVNPEPLTKVHSLELTAS